MSGEGGWCSPAAGRDFPKPVGVQLHYHSPECILPTCGREVRFLRGRDLTGSGEGRLLWKFITAPSWTSLRYDVTVVSTHPDIVYVLDIRLSVPTAILELFQEAILVKGRQ